jgi:hypothetical protein
VKTRLIAALAVTALAGCASGFAGVKEQIKVVTHPGGADCALDRRGKLVGRIGGTPGFTTIEKTWYDVTIRCNKTGYKEAVYRMRGTAAGIFHANVPGRGGVAGDSASDPIYTSDASYDVIVSLELVPAGAAAIQ